MELWNNATALAKAAQVTPYVFIVLGALVAASGIYLKGVIDNRVDTLVERTDLEMKNTPPEMTVRLATAASDGQVLPGKTLLEITSKNNIAYNARWHVTTRGGTLVSPFMTASVKINPAATPLVKTPIALNLEKVVAE